MAPKTSQKILIILIPVIAAGILGGLYYWKSRQSQPEEKPRWTLIGENEESHPALLDFPDGDEEDGLIQPDDTLAPVQNSSASRTDIHANGIRNNRIPTEAEVLQAANTLTENLLFRQILSQDSSLKMLVRLLDAVANGQSPTGLLGFVGDFPKFQARRNADGYLAATAANNDRFSRFIDAVTSIHPDSAAKWYRQAELKLQEILFEMGYREMSIRQLLTNAFTEILQIPEFSFDPELVPRGADAYDYQDPIFQGLHDAQKFIVRQGPDNCMKIRNFCQAVAKELELYKE